MNPAIVEQAIVNRLAPLRSVDLMVRALPNKTNEYGEINGNGQITVIWLKDTGELPLAMGLLQQRVETLWKLDIRLRNLRDATGAWQVMRAIAGYLMGWKPPGCNRMYLKTREFLGESEKGLWVFEVVFAAQTVLVEALPDEEGTLLQTITFELEPNGEV